MRKPIIAGNWKMHKTIKEAVKTFIDEGLWVIIIPPLSFIVVLVGMLVNIVDYIKKL